MAEDLAPSTTNRAKAPPVTFRDRALESRIQERVDGRLNDSLGLVAKRDLERYYDLLELELRQAPLALAEACLVCDALQGVSIVDDRWQALWADIGDAIRLRHLHEKWGIDPASAERLVENVQRAPL